MRSSKRAFALIVTSEVGSRAQYDREYARPSWPKGQSGVTVGIGYDLGYVTRDKVWKDFNGLLPDAMVEAMQNVVGLKGKAAQAALPAVRSQVLVPWDVAMKVFINRDMPHYEDMLLKECPRSLELPADCFGALTSIVYNRGAGGFVTDGERFTEMRAIRAAIANGKFDAIPGLIRSMKRLWEGTGQDGLIQRRENEAVLFEQGLINNGKVPDFVRREAPVVPPVTQEGNTGGNIVRTDLNVQPNDTTPYDVKIEAIQRNLIALRYPEVGDVDGKFGGRVRGTIVAFMVDRGKDPNNGEPTQAVMDELNKAIAEGWTRPMKPERAGATAKDVAAKLPVIDHQWWQKLWAYVLGLPSAASAVFSFIFGDQEHISDYVDPLKNLLSSIPHELYFGVVAVIAAAVLIQAKRAQDATVQAYQEGKIN